MLQVACGGFFTVVLEGKEMPKNTGKKQKEKETEKEKAKENTPEKKPQKNILTRMFSK